jgi:hypothetical protein
MRFPSYFLLAGLTVLLAVGCSYRGKCHKSRFDRNADCSQSCVGIIQQSTPQNLRAKITAFAAHHRSQADQVENVIEVERPPIEPALPAHEVAKSEVAKSIESRPDYSVDEIVPYENTQMRIPPVEPSLSTLKSSRLAYQTGQDPSPNDEIVTLDPIPAADIDSKKRNDSPGTSLSVSDSVKNFDTGLDPNAPPTDKLTAPSRSVLEANSSLSAELLDIEPADENIDLIWQEGSVSKTVEGIVTVPDLLGQREPVTASPTDQAVVDKVEKQIVLRARPQYRGTFIDSITRNTSQPNLPEPRVIPDKPVQQTFEMEPIDFQPLPAMQSAKVEVTSIEQPTDPPADNLDDSQPRYLPNQVPTMPNMVPIVTQKPATQETTPAASTNRVPTLQASSKKILEAIPRSDSAARLLKENSVASPLLHNPIKILRLRATTGLSSDQRFPPIVRFNTKALSNNQSLEANQIKYGEPNQIKLLPPNVDATNLPSYENAPMIDHARVNESIRRLTVRPEAENQPAEKTIDR